MTGFRSRFLLICVLSILAVMLVALMGFMSHSAVAAKTSNFVLKVDIDGAIDPAVAEYFKDALNEARNRQAKAVLVCLDTPGGLDDSMRSIIRDIFSADVPVIVYVAPQGARAASAGTFITMAAHIAAMAPGTNIGAAHPVMLLGNLPEGQEEKVVNDSAAFIKGIAKRNGRNQRWAESAVRKSASIAADEALDKNVIDYVADDIEGLLKKIDGKTVKTNRGSVVLMTKDAGVIDYPMSLRERLLHVLANPNIVYFLIILGFYGILFELYSPGLGLAGIGGAISLVLGMYSLQLLPVNYIGAGLIIFGMALLIAEALNPGFGVLGVGGIIATLVGSFIFIDSPVGAFRISPLVIVPVTAVMTASVVFIVGETAKIRRKKPLSGPEAMIGLEGEVIRRLDPVGEISVRGELWAAESIGGTIEIGETVNVVQLSGLKLKVKRPNN